MNQLAEKIHKLKAETIQNYGFQITEIQVTQDEYDILLFYLMSNAEGAPVAEKNNLLTGGGLIYNGVRVFSPLEHFNRLKYLNKLENAANTLRHVRTLVREGTDL